MSSLTSFHLDCHKLFDGVKLFPIEVDLARTALQYQQEVPPYQVLQETFFNVWFWVDIFDFISQELVDTLSDAEEAKPIDEENILKLDNNDTNSDLLKCDSNVESSNLMAILDTGDLIGNHTNDISNQNNQDDNLLQF